MICQVELALLYIFTLETLFKVSAYVIFSDHLLRFVLIEVNVTCMCVLYRLGKLYFNDAWNWLDLIVVVEGWISTYFSSDGSALTGIKTFRILRPLRVANRLPDVKMIVGALFGSLPSIGDIFIVFFCFLFIFAMLCGTLWSGSFVYRCQDIATGEWVDIEELCYPEPSTAGGTFCSSLNFLDAPYTCEQGEICTLYGENPEGGAINFDNILYGFLTLFVTCTMEGWSNIMFYTQDTMGLTSFFVFVAVIVLGSFVIMNLMVASILVELGCLDDFHEEQKVERKLAAI